MKSMIRVVNDHGNIYECLAFVCPGCVEMLGGSGLHMLPVNATKKNPSWTWDGNLFLPTLNPSILTGKGTPKICHSFLREGEFEFLSDCTHSLAGKKTMMPDLPEWFIKEKDE
jgi:hypothetical protein